MLSCKGDQIQVDALVFVTRFGNPFDAATVTHRFETFLKDAGIGHNRFHDLGHTAATLLAIQGVHPSGIGLGNLSMLIKSGMERETGFEPATSTLARLHSTS